MWHIFCFFSFPHAKGVQRPLANQTNPPPPQQLDSAFQLQEHLAALHYHHTANGTQPITRETAHHLAQPPPGIDRTLWLYELCRFLIAQCNSLIVGFLFDSPACSSATCPEMRASEWQFLCAVHEQPKSCCAIDYCCHTLDWAAVVVTDQKLFPSRFVVLGDAHGPGGAGGKNVGVKSLINVFRRLHRIFAHAWFQHRSVFWAVEGQTGLYVFFKMVCDLYDLLPAENYKLPPEAEGLESPAAEPEPEKPVPQILKPQSQQQSQQQRSGDDNDFPVGRTNTRRHIRSSPSTGSAVTTVIEADEEETGALARRVKEMHLSAPETVSEEPEVVDIPVMVEPELVPPAPEGAEEEKGSIDDDLASDTERTVVGAADPGTQPTEVETDTPTDAAPSDAIAIPTTPSDPGPEAGGDSEKVPSPEEAPAPEDDAPESDEHKPSDEKDSPEKDADEGDAKQPKEGNEQ